MTRIPPRSGTAFELAKGASLTVIDPKAARFPTCRLQRTYVREVISNGRRSITRRRCT